MESNNARKNILNRIRKALAVPTPKPFPRLEMPDSGLYERTEEDLDLLFAEELIKVGGQFIYCESDGQFLNNVMDLAATQGWEYFYCWDTVLQEVFQEFDFRNCRIGQNLSLAHAGLTRCEALIARTGSILLSSGLPSGRTLSVFPPVHIVLAYTSQLVYNMDDGLNLMQQKYGAALPSFITFATGPSRTADIEKTLVLGAHGPREVYVFLVEDRKEEIEAQ